jgi:hypothetical protein
LKKSTININGKNEYDDEMVEEIREMLDLTVYTEEWHPEPKFLCDLKKLY